MQNLTQLKETQRQAARKELDNKLLFLQKLPCIENRLEQQRLLENHRLWNEVSR